jgi:hypothetical protein
MVESYIWDIGVAGSSPVCYTKLVVYQLVDCYIWNVGVTGSSPVHQTKHSYQIARIWIMCDLSLNQQRKVTFLRKCSLMVEQRTVNSLVVGSTPSTCANFLIMF